MNFKKLAVLPLAILSVAAVADEDVNYGDPTASFSTIGASRSHDSTQINGMAGFGNHIVSLDVTQKDNGRNATSFRGRYFYVTDGLGGSVDVVSDADSTTVLGGAIYKIPVTDNITVFPMASLGHTSSRNNRSQGTDLAQVGVYAMYGFDAGHWLYANPKTTYVEGSRAYMNQFEIGGGYMVASNASVGFKLEHTLKNAKMGMAKDETTFWVNANYYF